MKRDAWDDDERSWRVVLESNVLHAVIVALVLVMGCEAMWPGATASLLAHVQTALRAGAR